VTVVAARRESVAHRVPKNVPRGTPTPDEAGLAERAGELEQERAAVYDAAEGFYGGGVVFAGGVEAEALDSGGGAAGVEGAAD
jgi:hypothetical protein